jgi:hypothetical protein
MPLSALESAIKILERRSASLEPWLDICVACVVTGVALEVWFVIWEYKDGLRDFRRESIRSPDRPSTGKLIFELLGAVLVAIGVAGEFWVDWKAGNIRVELQAKNGEVRRIFAGQITEATVQLDDARSKLKEAQDEIGRLIPWNLDAAESERITMSLSRFSKTTFSLSVDPTANNFWETIQVILQSAKWQQGWSPYHPYKPNAAPPTGIVSRVGIVVEYPPGLAIGGQPPATLTWTWEQAGKALASALESAGIKPARISPIQTPSGRGVVDIPQLNVIVGHKP